MIPKKIKSHSVKRRLVGTAVGAETEDSRTRFPPIPDG
jgi:hypothetical protein